MSFPLLFIRWHISEAPVSIARGVRNVLWFNFHFFSLGTLLRTLFSPWRRQQWSYRGGFHPGEYLEMVFSNMVSRILGSMVRSFVIFLSIGTGFLLLLFGIGVLLFWYAFPILTLFAFFHGFRIIF